MSSSHEQSIDADSFEVLLRSVDPAVPLDGESGLDGSSLDEARTWVGVYREIVELEQRVLDTILSRLPSLSPYARTEAETTNVPLIKGQLDRFRHRLELWEDHLDELAGRDDAG